VDFQLSPNRLLLEVTSVVAWGRDSPQALSPLPSGIDDVAKAATIVILFIIVTDLY
jgi:hypothetical protein